MILVGRDNHQIQYGMDYRLCLMTECRGNEYTNLRLALSPSNHILIAYILLSRPQCYLEAKNMQIAFLLLFQFLLAETRLGLRMMISVTI